ncbi:MAG: DUF4136 domain-containing protein [Bacteroidales bacterium]
MKKTFFALLAILAIFASCEKDPDLDKVQDQYMVYTQHDKNVSFDTFKSFYIPDSILIVGNSDKKTYLKSEESNAASKIIDAYVSNMEKRGFKKVDDKTEADLGLQLSFIEETRYLTNWWDYPYYWEPGYWWNGWYGPNWNWYYPYPITYSFTTGTLLGELIDLKKANSTTKESTTTPKPTVVWSSFISGFIYNLNSIDVNQAVSSVNQAFVQSAYLKTTPAPAAK